MEGSEWPGKASHDDGHLVVHDADLLPDDALSVTAPVKNPGLYRQ